MEVSHWRRPCLRRPHGGRVELTRLDANRRLLDADLLASNGAEPVAQDERGKRRVETRMPRIWGSTER
jgi:hypothetical protein